MKTESPVDDDLKKVSDMIKGIAFAMLTTQEPDGTLHSRPMKTEAMQSDGRLIFITAASSPKVWEVMQQPKVSLTYITDDASVCVAIAGHAQENRNLAKLKELWKPLYKAWFPGGLEDPNVTLLEVTIDRAEYWKTPSSKFVLLYGATKAMLTGKPIGATVGEHQRIPK